MSQFLSSPMLFLGLGAALLLVIIHDLIRGTLRFSHRLLKFEFPKGNSLRLIAILQVAVGILVTIILRLIHNDPVLDLGIGAAVMLLSGLFFVKVFLKYHWKISLLVWSVALVMQLIFIPLVTAATLAVFILLASLLFPPQY